MGNLTFEHFLLLPQCFQKSSAAVRTRLYEGKGKYGKSLTSGILLKEVEIIVANEENACFEQFLLLPQCFPKSSAAEVSESVFMWERVNKVL